MTLSSSAVLVLAIAAVVGVVLGLVFYGGLYWTVSHGLVSKRPALWFLFSLLARVSIVIAGFYFVSSYPLQGLTVPSLSISAHTRLPLGSASRASSSSSSSSSSFAGSSFTSAPVLSHSTEPVLQMERLISCLLAFTITGLIIRWLSRPSKLERLPQLSEQPKSMGGSVLPEPSLETSSQEVGHASDS
jgi:F1F0 ATPase subunit 2